MNATMSSRNVRARRARTQPLFVLMLLMWTAASATAQIITGGSVGGYQTVGELGTIANGGTVTCAFASAPICHFTVASGSTGFTIANPSSNPPTAGQLVTVAWTQAAAGFPAITWGSLWYGYNNSNDSIDLLSNQSGINNFIVYSNAATGAPGLSFTWDGTHYVLNVVGRQQITQLNDRGTGAFAGGLSFGSSLTLQNVAASQTAPTISSGFGTSPTIAASNGTLAFTVNVGTGGTATSGVIGLPTANANWDCKCTDITTASATVFITKQTARANNSCTVGNFNTSGAAAAWAASDVLSCSAMAY